MYLRISHVTIYNFIKSASEAGHKILAVSNSHDLPAIKNVEQVKLDLTDSSALQRVVLDMFPEMVVNCAAISSPVDVDANPELAEKMNVVLPENLAHLSDWFWKNKALTHFRIEKCHNKDSGSVLTWLHP